MDKLELLSMLEVKDQLVWLIFMMIGFLVVFALKLVIVAGFLGCLILVGTCASMINVRRIITKSGGFPKKPPIKTSIPPKYIK